MNRAWLAAALSAFALAACDEASSPAPTPGTVVANVYVDTDLTGTLSPDDDVPEGLTVALVAVEGGAVVQTEEVDADGTVTFADVMPGAYRVQIGGTAPAGSVLSGSEAPRAVIPYTGGTVEVDFRFVYFPGSISGRVYRDDNGDGNYDAGVDTPGDGLWVVLILPLSGGDARIDSVRTDDEGLYAFPTLAPQEFRLEFQALGTMDYGPDGATRTAPVPPATAVTYDMIYTGTQDVAITIAEARALGVGSSVIVRGFVTVPPNVVTFTSGGVTFTEIWLQDATGGIASLVLPAGVTDVALGDEIEVSGTISANGGALQIGGTGTVGRRRSRRPARTTSWTRRRSHSPRSRRSRTRASSSSPAHSSSTATARRAARGRSPRSWTSRTGRRSSCASRTRTPGSRRPTSRSGRRTTSPGSCRASTRRRRSGRARTRTSSR
jgi:hypothetical protein